MKKLIFIFTVLVCMCSNAFASDIDVISGDDSFLKKASGNAKLEIVWAGAKYDKKQPLEKHYKNLAELKRIGKNGFIKTFNKKCKTVQVVENGKAKYKFTVKVTNMDSYVKVMGFSQGLATKVWGKFTVTDTSTGKKIVEANIDEVTGSADLSPDDSFSKCFEELGKQISKLK